ncbi:hypothetical protein WOLCODRAFT_67744 [Wolfiporia cocos MD-104 SS10]|uniref:Arrestin-like N-terminal domain-containing protein n=1 Tax=Wolfiporia cocos (strain MD-104) TaxID=742152 RepID=A0A2H3JEJ4_WOLCO|nr:hypothetical protein WOLCODRAFT_67744 [Wolfiporia cocos MD-104 SS10]
MSTTNLPGYTSRTPAYTSEPQPDERRLALNRLWPRPSSEFVKQSKTGAVSLRLIEQEDNVSLPVYGCGDTVEGAVNLTKPNTATSVEVKLEGRLRLKEVAEGGTTTNQLCLFTVMLWSQEGNLEPCPSSLPFSFTIPTTFSDGKNIYPLPPTHEAHLAGVPGFHAVIDYYITVTVQKNKPAGLLRAGSSIISTPLLYYPRSRPAVPLPPPLLHNIQLATLLETPEWRCYDSAITAKLPGGKDIISRFYVPSARVFCMSEPIPFHLTFTSSALSLAAFLPLGPTNRKSSKHCTHVQLLRQTNVDVRNAVILGTKTDIWQTLEIGNGTFRLTGDGPDWIAFAGEVYVKSQIKVGGFKAGGLTIKDFLVLSMTPPEPTKAPFNELRQVIPVRLTTDPWSADGARQIYADSEFSVPSSPEESRLDVHSLPYRAVA